MCVPCHSGPPRSAHGGGGDDDDVSEVLCIGSSSRSHPAPQASSSRQAYATIGRSSIRPQSVWDGTPQPIAVPSGGPHGGISAQKGFSTQSDSYPSQSYRPSQPKPQPLKGVKGASGYAPANPVSTRAADAADTRAAKDREALQAAQEDTRNQELARYKKAKVSPRQPIDTDESQIDTDESQKLTCLTRPLQTIKNSNSSPFNPGMNTLHMKQRSTAAVQTPPPGQVARAPGPTSPYFSTSGGPPSSSRNGGSFSSTSSKLRHSIPQPLPTPTRPSARTGPVGDSRAFATEGDDALRRPVTSHPTREVLSSSPPSRAEASAPKKEVPNRALVFKKKTPAQAATKESVQALKQRKNLNAQPVVVESSDDEANPAMSQQTEDIGEFDDDDNGTSSRPAASASRPTPAVKTPAASLVDNRPPVNLEPLPTVRPASRPILVRDDDEAVPIRVPQEGTVRRKKGSIVGGMAGAKVREPCSLPPLANLELPRLTLPFLALRWRRRRAA